MRPHLLAKFFGAKLIKFRQIWLDLGKIWENLGKIWASLGKSD